MNLYTCYYNLTIASFFHNVDLHFEQAFISKAQSQSMSVDFFAFKQASVQRTNDLTFGTNYIRNICNAAEFQGTSKAGHIGIVVLCHSLISFFGAAQWSFSSWGNIHHDATSVAVANTVVAAAVGNYRWRNG